MYFLIQEKGWLYPQTELISTEEKEFFEKSIFEPQIHCVLSLLFATLVKKCILRYGH